MSTCFFLFRSLKNENWKKFGEEKGLITRASRCLCCSIRLNFRLAGGFMLCSTSPSGTLIMRRLAAPSTSSSTITSEWSDHTSTRINSWLTRQLCCIPAQHRLLQWCWRWLEAVRSEVTGMGVSSAVRDCARPRCQVISYSPSYR